MTQARMMTISEAAAFIADGKSVLVAGDEAALRELPQGSWIGGTIPYFMTTEGGVVDKNQVFVNPLPEGLSLDSVKLYDADGLATVYADGPSEGVSFIIVPATSAAHLTFAKEAQNYEGYLSKPLVGWVSGVHLDDLGKIAPQVVDGQTRTFSGDKAVVMHCAVAEGLAANLDIVNLFTQGDGDTITFDEVGFAFETATVNGEKVPFAKYLADKGVDTKLPLVADYYGAPVNVSFQGVDEGSGTVSLYAPVFPGVEYRVAKPVADYVQSFEGAIPEGAGTAAFACNCILNFLYGELEGRKTKDAVGPITFGEIAYQLLNQTFVYVDVA